MINSYAQNKEDLIVLDYFKGFKGKLLDVGANDGVTFSNSCLLIQQGWEAVLLEPSEVACDKLRSSYGCSTNVLICYWGLASEEGTRAFYESANHVEGGSDVALVSTLYTEEVIKWPKVKFKKTEALFTTFKQAQDTYHTFDRFDFISIDAEGSDWEILQQINLKEVGCKCLCIEYNSKPILHGLYTNYVKKYGMKQIHINAENVIYAL
jgi:FkbM family methyltransferase